MWLVFVLFCLCFILFVFYFVLFLFCLVLFCFCWFGCVSYRACRLLTKNTVSPAIPAFCVMLVQRSFSFLTYVYVFALVLFASVINEVGMSTLCVSCFLPSSKHKTRLFACLDFVVWFFFVCFPA